MPASFATPGGTRPRAAWPLLVLLLALIAPGCTRDASSPKRNGVPIALHLRFAESAAPTAGPTAAPTAAPTAERGVEAAEIDAIEQLVISAYENAEFPVLRASQTIAIAPGQQRFSAELSVPPADSYTITVDANGVFGSGNRASLPGTLYYGSTDLTNITAGSSPSAEVVVRRIVPTPVLERSAGSSYTVRWNAITGATNYRLRETSSGAPQDIVTSDVSVPIEIRGLRERFGPTAEAVSYRVRAEFDDRLRENFASAFSESVQVILPGNVAPAAVADLVVASVSPDSVVLEWTSPGDDGTVGQAQRYDLRSSFQPITEQNFAIATAVLGTPVPSPAGRRERLILRGLLNDTTYFFALKTADEVPNWSPLSNLTQVTTPNAADVTPPAGVTNLSAIALRDGEVDLRWTATGDDGQIGTAARREVRWSADPITESNFASANLAPDASAPSASGTVEGLTVRDLPRRTTLNFALRTIDEANNASPISNVLTVTLPDLTAPAAITDLRVQDVGAASVALAWTATGDDGTTGQAEGYDLRFSTSAITESNFGQSAQVGGLPNPAPSGDEESVVVGNLDPNTTYFFAIRVNDLAGNLSPLSNVPSATTGSLVPAAPSDLIATAITDTTVALDWIDHASNETSYVVERVRPSDPGQVVRFLLGRSFDGHVTFTDTQVIDRTDYRYRVLARNDAGDSAPSNDLLLHTGVRAPRGLSISDPTTTTLRLSWIYSALAPESFRIERRTDLGAWGVDTSVQGSSVGYVDVGLDPSTNYTYRVVAVADGLESAPSNEASGRTLDLLGVCDIAPTSLDFGTVFLQSDSTRTLTIENIGTGPLGVAPSLESGCVDFAIVGGGDPVTLGPNEQRLVSVRFTPSAAAARSCDLLLGNDCSRVPLSGVGALTPVCDVAPLRSRTATSWSEPARPATSPSETRAAVSSTA
ncbi:MAG: fibronectin type III domain-containing protein [Candidatus Eisenbacteria bacterium]